MPDAASVETSPMNAMTELALERENRCHRGTGGVSSRSRGAGFRPAFLDTGTRAVYLSRFADGRMAPFHTLEGLPDELVLARNAGGRACAVKGSVISGFERAGAFYTRGEAAAVVAADGPRGEAGDEDAG
jgi:hypothetical protein